MNIYNIRSVINVEWLDLFVVNQPYYRKGIVFRMLIVKVIMLVLVFGTISAIGVKLANGYVVRANNLKQIKKGLKLLEAKITYTYEELPDLFIEISKKIKGNVGKLFYDVGKRMELEFAGEAWEKCVDESKLNLNNEDRDLLKSLGKLLGNTDIQGQLNQIYLVNNFLDEQIKDATEARAKNEVMYKKLGVIVGLAVVIVLI